jgi:hypothetical protein
LFKTDSALREPRMMARAIWLAGAAALLPALAGTSALVAETPAADRFDPPQVPLELTRTLWRDLRDGKQVMVRQRFELRFSSDGAGYRVDGKLVGTEVTAPPALAGLAEIERSRVDAGGFPLMLDHAGHIRSEDGSGDPAARAALAAKAGTLSSGPNLTASEQARVRTGLAQLIASARPTGWPIDLFNPARAARHERRELDLPGGDRGAVDVTIQVDGLQPGHLPRAFERRVVTELDGVSRSSREVWEIALPRPVF